MTAAGQVLIESISEVDYVYASDHELGESGYKRVVQTFVNETDELVHLQYDGTTVTTTPTHPFYQPQKGWIDAIDLRAGDILVTSNGEYVVIEAVEHELLESPITVYNFEVEDLHTYYVGDTSVLVHNECNKGVGDRGWEGDATWRHNVNTVGNGGTIEQLRGGIPTQSQGVKLIKQAGGSILRIEGPHQFPNPHTYDHINYLVRGIKGTLRILLEK